jgi:hypothetical protein
MKAGWLLVGAAVAMAGAGLMASSGTQERRSRSSRDWDNGKNWNWNIHTRHDRGEPISSCGDIDATVSRGEMARDEEVQNLSVSALNVTGHVNGPVYVTGADRNDYQVTLCKFAAADTGDEARTKLGQLALSVNNGRVNVKGPSDNGYLAYLLVETPREAHLAVNTINGPLTLRSLSGQITARTTNGPLSVSQVSGEVDVEATNGPVSLNEGGGHMRVVTQNGPLSVNLSGSDWQGSGLEASTQNGPLSLNVPENYRSGVLVDITGNGPFHCSNSACRNAQRDWDNDNRRLRFGSDPNPIVRLTSGNGPVSIGSGKDN